MLEKIPNIKPALTDEQLQDRARESAAMSPEERENARLDYFEVLQKQPTITLTLEEAQEIEEKKKREGQKAA